MKAPHDLSLVRTLSAPAGTSIEQRSYLAYQAARCGETSPLNLLSSRGRGNRRGAHHHPGASSPYSR